MPSARGTLPQASAVGFRPMPIKFYYFISRYSRYGETHGLFSASLLGDCPSPPSRSHSVFRRLACWQQSRAKISITESLRPVSFSLHKAGPFLYIPPSHGHSSRPAERCIPWAFFPSSSPSCLTRTLWLPPSSFPSSSLHSGSTPSFLVHRRQQTMLPSTSPDPHSPTSCRSFADASISSMTASSLQAKPSTSSHCFEYVLTTSPIALPSPMGCLGSVSE